MAPLFDAATGVYRSPRPSINLQQYLDGSFPQLLFSRKDDVHNGRPALIDAPTGRSLHFAQLKSRCLSLAAALRDKLGVKAGDVVMLLAPNSVDYPVVFLAVMALGAAVTTVNPVNLRVEVSKQAKDSGSRLVFTVAALVDKVVDLEMPIVLMDEGRVDCRQVVFTMDGLLKGSKTLLDEHELSRVKVDDTAALLYSSGTTGTSKGVILSHRNLIAAVTIFEASENKKLASRSVLLCVLPMFHVYGFVIATCTYLWRGVPIVVMPSFDFEVMLGVIQKYKVTIAPFVPPIVLALSKSPLVSRYNLSSLTEIPCGAAPLSREVIDACNKRLPGVFIKQGYGLTETSAIASKALDDDTEHYGSTGVLAANMEAKVVDVGTGRPLPPNQRGEIWLRGPPVMQGYLRNAKATAETLDAGGWLHTGDLGCIDEAGNMYIVDRIKELIKYKGFQVAPAELEALLLSHSEILDAAVIPFPDEAAGEVPLAVIVRRPGSNIDEETVKKFVAEQVAPYKKVRKVMFIDKIPKSASGKILRRELVHLSSSPRSRL